MEEKNRKALLRFNISLKMFCLQGLLLKRRFVGCGLKIPRKGQWVVRYI
jgi:hypothetical protein